MKACETVVARLNASNDWQILGTAGAGICRSWWSMIFSENRYPPRIESGAGFFGTMLHGDKPDEGNAGTAAGGSGVARARAMVALAALSARELHSPGRWHAAHSGRSRGAVGTPDRHALRRADGGGEGGRPRPGAAVSAGHRRGFGKARLSLTRPGPRRSGAPVRGINDQDIAVGERETGRAADCA